MGNLSKKLKKKKKLDRYCTGQLFQCLWTAQENILHSSPLKSDWVPQPRLDLPGCLTHGLAAAVTASPLSHCSLFPAREPSKAEEPTSSIPVTSCRLFSNIDPREKGEMIQNILEDKHHRWVIRSICCLSLATKTWIPSFLWNNQHGAPYPKERKVG